MKFYMAFIIFGTWLATAAAFGLLVGLVALACIAMYVVTFCWQCFEE
jgi:hypothetical protein